ncbi:MAG: type II toxin-antitoxin system PemK/MazF family toxin [Geminicoccaceae bacterium]
MLLPLSETRVRSVRMPESSAVSYQASRFAIACPITSRVRPLASSVVLPDGLAVQGEVLTSHVRSIDTMARPIRRAGQTVSPSVLVEIRASLSSVTLYP